MGASVDSSRVVEVEEHVEVCDCLVLRSVEEFAQEGREL